MKQKINAEIDVDGVLAVLDGSYEPYVKQYIPDFSEEKYVKSWGMENIRQLSEEAYQTIHRLWVTPEFMGSLPRFPRVEEGMRLLVATPGLNITVHTHLLEDNGVVRARHRWIKRLERDVGGKFDIDICCGPQKSMRKDSYFVIEDSVRNLNNSSAKIKFLIRRSHNEEFTVRDILNCEEAYVVPDFYTAATIIHAKMTNNLLVCDYAC